MDEFAILSPSEREPYIRETAARMNVSEVIIEKDFWVCWVLQKLFSLDGVKGHLIFKGGTSLSKCYRIIQRFSEDIDISVSREHLGFGGDQDPASQTSNKKAKNKVDELGEACTQWVTGPLLEKLTGKFSVLGDQQWEISVDPDDNDQQTLLFAYPSALEDNLSYIKKSVKIEMGARSDHYPAEERSYVPYIKSELPQAPVERQNTLKVLKIERTFWEKVTLLHAECHRDPSKSMPPRLSRHLYDLSAIANSEYLESAISEHGLLKAVADHKSVFFKSGWARYDLARPGTLRICPPQERIKELERDYQAMRPMFFNDPPPLSGLLEAARDIEDRING